MTVAGAGERGQRAPRLGGVLIWLIAIFFFAFFVWFKNTGLWIVFSGNTSGPRNFQIIRVINCPRYIQIPRRLGLKSLTEIGPFKIIDRPSRQNFLNGYLLSGLQREFRKHYSIALFHLSFPDLMDYEGQHHYVATGENMRWRTSSIDHEKSQFAFSRFSKLKTKIQRLHIPNDDLRAILQNQSPVFNLPRLLHLCELAFHVCGLYTHSLPLKSHVAAGPLHLVSLTRHDLRLSAVDDHLSDKREELQESNNNQQPCKSLDLALYLYIVIGVGCGVLNFGGWMLVIGRRKWRLLGWLALVVSSVALLTDLGTFAFGGPLAFWRLRWLLGDDEHCDYQPLHRDQLYYRKCLTDYTLCTTVSDMANVLSAEKQTAIIAALAEGSSIRSIERITGVHRDTIMRLGVRIGKGCAMLLDSKMQDLDCNYLQLDELWGFIGKKERHCSVDDSPEFGDVWTFCAIDSETKLVPSFRCGKRTHELATEFAMDIASRMRHRVQVSSDAMHSYIGAMELAFGADVDYGQCVKVYVYDSAEHPERKYSAPSFASAYRRPITGNPEIERVSTSHVERLNATTRLHVKRLNRLTLAFSKKLENFQAAVALHFAYYNFVRRHNALRMTPAMAAGIERDFWSVGDLVEAVS
jgi:IS1 family transposase